MRIIITCSLFIILSASFVRAQDIGTKEPVGEILYPIIESRGVNEAVREYYRLKEQAVMEYDLSESAINALGYRLLGEQKEKEAVAVFRFNAELHPESINVWDSLAEGLLANGKNKEAASLYSKVLEKLEADSTLPPNRKNFLKNNATFRLFQAENFDHPSEADIRYVSFYGGVPAGKWEMQHLADYKHREDIALHYEGFNLYWRPVPANVQDTFESNYPADVSHSFMSGDYRRFIEDKKIADISELWEKNDWNRVFPEPFKRMATYDGRQYFIPMAYQWNPVWYRRDIFEKHGLQPPKTWQELLNLCDDLNELGYAPFTISVQNWPPPVARWFTILNLRINGPEFHDRVMKGQEKYTDGRIRDVFEYWSELFSRKAFSDSSFNNSYQTGIQEITEGKAVMYNLGEWLFESLDEEQEKKLDFFPFPEINPNVMRAEIVHAYGAFITADNAGNTASEALLSWLASAESQQSNASSNQRTVASLEVDRATLTETQGRIMDYVNRTNELVPLFEVNTHPDFAAKALTIFQEFWKTRDIDTVLNKLEIARLEIFPNTKKR